jgi:hypothetical protein
MEVAFKTYEEKIIYYTLTNLKKKIYLIDHLMAQNQDYSKILKEISDILKNLIM